MATFNYKAKDRSGNTVTGMVEAPNESAAAASVREKGYLPMEIHVTRSQKQAPAGGSRPSIVDTMISPLWTGVNIKALALFYRQLATLLGSGMSLSEALRSARARTRGRLGSIIEEAQLQVQAGRLFSETLNRYPRIFSPLQVSLVRVGESGGLLQSMIERIASYLEYEIKIRQMISRMMFYPVLILIFAVLVKTFVPYAPKLMSGNPSEILVGMAPELFRIALLFVGIVVVLKLLFQFNIIRLIWDTVKIVPPIMGTSAHKIAMSRFCRAMAVVYSAGMPTAEAVDIASDATGNLAIARKLKYAIPAIQSGHGLTESLAKTGAVMPMVLDMLTTGEKAGSIDAVLQKVADYMDDETDSTLHKLGIVLFILMILIAGIVVMKIVIDFYLKYINGIANQVK